MRITSVDVSILDVPVERTYTAGGHAASSNWHVLSRVNTEDGVQGIGYAVNTRSTMIRALGQAARELGEHLVGANVLEVEAARGPPRARRRLDWARRHANHGHRHPGHRHVGCGGQAPGPAPVPDAWGLPGPAPSLRQRLAVDQPLPRRAGPVGPQSRGRGIPGHQDAGGRRGQAGGGGCQSTSRQGGRGARRPHHGGRRRELGRPPGHAYRTPPGGGHRLAGRPDRPPGPGRAAHCLTWPT